MPEGDTVRLTAVRLHAALAGRRLVAGELRVPAWSDRDLAGSLVRQVISRGKHLLTRLDTGVTVHSHLRMEGSWRVFPAGQRWHGGPGWQVRAVLSNEAHTAVGYRLGIVELIDTSQESRVVGHLGPDLLGADWDPARAAANLADQPHRAIGEALLDQRNLAGLGNLYRLEVCFLTGLNPWTPVGDLSAARLARVVALSHRLLVANQDRWDQVTTGNRRRGQEHWVFERGGLPCRRCGTTVQRAWQGPAPQQRVTYWCPSCQPAAGGAGGS